MKKSSFIFSFKKKIITMSQYNSQDNIKVLTLDVDTETKDTLEIHEIKKKTFRVRDYIPKRNNKKLLKPLLKTSSIIILFLIVIIITVTSLNQRQNCHCFGVNDKKNNSYFQEKQISTENNNSEKTDALFTKEITLPDINYDERIKINKKSNSHNPKQDTLRNDDNFRTNGEKDKNGSSPQKYISKGNNSSEKYVFYTKEITLPDINYSEKANEKSDTTFLQVSRDTNSTEKIEEPIKHIPQEKIIHDDDSKKPNNHLPQKIILHDDASIYFFYPNTKEYKLLYKAENTISAFTAYNKGIIFVTETNISQIYYLPNESLNATKKNLSIIFEEPKVTPYAMEIDFVSENLYIIDKEMGAVIIINITTKNYNLLLTDLKNPSDIVLDCTEGLMFIVQMMDSVLRSNMDGRQSMKIVENIGITAITVNKQEKRIYWVSDVSNIESSTYDGKNRKLFLEDSFHISSLTMIEDQLFWLCPAHGLANATLLFSKTDNGISVSTHGLETIHILENPKSIKPVSYENQISNSFNHSCQHIGMQTPGRGYNCTCNIGWQLHSDCRSCRPVTDFILYNKGKFIRGCMLDINKASALDIMWPTPYDAQFLIYKKSIHFDYDLKNDDFYFSDDRNLYVMKLKAHISNQTTLLTVDEENAVIEDIAFDWFTGNLYYIERVLNSNWAHSLIVFNTKLGIGFQKTLKTFSYKNYLPFTGCPYALIVNPYRNFLFFNKFHYDQNEMLRTMEKNNMKGVDISQAIIRDDINTFTNDDINTFGLVIAIDYMKEKIYRISESDLNARITYTNFDGLNEITFIVESVNYVKSIYLHKQWLYLSNETSIWRVHKETGKDAVKVTPRFEDDLDKKITKMKIISPSIPFTRSKNNLCAVNNGNCEQFCFNGLKVTCDCQDDKSIQDDGRHCG